MVVFWGKVGGGGVKSSLLSKLRVFNWSLDRWQIKLCTILQHAVTCFAARGDLGALPQRALTSCAKHSRRTQRAIVQRVVKQQYSKPLLQADSSVQITRTVRVRCTAANVFHCNSPFAWETVYVLSSEQRVLREQVGCRVMVGTLVLYSVYCRVNYWDSRRRAFATHSTVRSWRPRSADPLRGYNL